jgi:hypothetical protein
MTPDAAIGVHIVVVDIDVARSLVIFFVEELFGHNVLCHDSTNPSYVEIAHSQS